MTSVCPGHQLHGKDRLRTRLRAGNFKKKANAFGGAGVNLAALMLRPIWCC